MQASGSCGERAMNLFTEYPELNDGIVQLGKMTIADADAVADLTSQAHVYATLPTFLYELKYEDKRMVITLMDRECFDTRMSILLGIYLCERPDQMIGIAEIYNYNPDKAKASIGYRMSDKYWGRGIATRATVLLRDYLIQEAGIRTITAHVLSENEASARVLTKAGFNRLTLELPEDWGYNEPLMTAKFELKMDDD